ncbi:MAG: hypothetical protein EAZ95_02955 [Bacteroidetes bacterium]|nr:MAG: hypothetical protein EAZ95_02955 [Bacteroidota bacterium]
MSGVFVFATDFYIFAIWFNFNFKNMKTQVSLDLKGKNGRATFDEWLELLGWEKLPTGSTWEVNKKVTSTDDMEEEILQDLKKAFAETKLIASVKYDFLSVSGEIPD